MRSSEQVGFSNRWFYLQNLSHPHAAILWSNVKILILLNMKMNSKRPKGVHSILVVTNSTQLKDQCWLYDPWASKQMWKKFPETERHLIYECLLANVSVGNFVSVCCNLSLAGALLQSEGELDCDVFQFRSALQSEQCSKAECQRV